MTIDAWTKEVNRLLDEATRIDFGYPIGSNVLLLPDAPTVVETALRHVELDTILSLRSFYSQCGGIKWPGIRNGYFLFRATELARSDPENVPDSVTGPYADNIVVVGSSGGGDMFAIAKKSMAILHLPPGPMCSGKYEDEARAVRLLAPDFSSLLQLLLDDLAAFVRDVPKHKFIV